MQLPSFRELKIIQMDCIIVQCLLLYCYTHQTDMSENALLNYLLKAQSRLTIKKLSQLLSLVQNIWKLAYAANIRLVRAGLK